MNPNFLNIGMDLVQNLVQNLKRNNSWLRFDSWWPLLPAELRGLDDDATQGNAAEPLEWHWRMSGRDYAWNQP